MLDRQYMSTDAAAPTDPATSAPPAPPALSGLLGLPVLRVALVGVAALITWLAFALTGDPGPFPPTILFAALAMLPVNLISLALVRRALHRSGRRARDLIDFSWRRLGTDVLWGLLWLTVLSVPYMLAILGVMFARFGTSAFEHFEEVFVSAESAPALSPAVLAVLAIATVVTFAPLNAPVEELVYRGYSQGGLVKRWPAFWAVLVPAVIFASQHVFYAATPDAVPVFLAAFFVWGIGSGLIVLWQRRLMPIIVAHFLVNLFLSAPALVFAFLPPEALAG